MSLFEPRAFAPLPGTAPSPRGLFIDLWGTLVELPEEGEKKSASGLRFCEGVLDALFRAHRAGWLIYLLGNEDDVAFGRLSDEEWEAIDTALSSAFAGDGIRIQRQYVCLDHPEGVGAHRFDSVFLLPNTGLFYHAMHNDSIDLDKSWVIGDSTVELVSGWRAGMRLAGVRTGLAVEDGAFHVTPDFTAADAAEAVLGVLGHHPVELH